METLRDPKVATATKLLSLVQGKVDNMWTNWKLSHSQVCHGMATTGTYIILRWAKIWQRKQRELVCRSCPPLLEGRQPGISESSPCCPTVDGLKLLSITHWRDGEGLNSRSSWNSLRWTTGLPQWIIIMQPQNTQGKYPPLPTALQDDCCSLWRRLSIPPAGQGV